MSATIYGRRLLLPSIYTGGEKNLLQSIEKGGDANEYDRFHFSTFTDNWSFFRRLYDWFLPW
jgi:hypothetical protein